MPRLCLNPLSKSALPLVLVGPLVLAAIAAPKPYVPDAATLHLYHFDEHVGQTITPNLGSVGGHAIAVVERRITTEGYASDTAASSDVLGAPAAPGFGFAAQIARSTFARNPANNQVIGFDADGNGAYTQHATHNREPVADQYQLGLPSLAGPDGSFTLEAMINLDEIATVVEGKGIPRNIIATDSALNAQRGWTFRIYEDSIQFNSNLPTARASLLSVPIPLSGPHAFSPGSWFHVAYTYDASPGLVRVYWTRVDSAARVASLLYESPPDTRIKLADITPHLTFGGDGRGAVTESLGGLLDEVRISSIARAPHDFIFQPADFEVTVGRDGGDIQLGWSAPQPITSLINIYRHTSPRKDGRVHIAALHSEVSIFADRVPSSSAKYWYWLGYLDAAGLPVEHGPFESKAASVWKP